MTKVSADILPKLIAFYLPQFHPISENDLWWGKGFTEWSNVTRARPAFPGHYQPHLPADLGFYDLRLPEVRLAQAQLARDHGIFGFCYYHYWFNGHRLLERPFNEVLASGQPDFPFCLCWANESWTRRWDGQEQEVLISQRYDDNDHLAHLRRLAAAFKDPRYIRVEGRPLFLVYRAGHVPDPLRMTKLWREEARRLGVGELYLCNVQGHDAAKPADGGFDAAVEFHPGIQPLGFPSRIGGHKVYSCPAIVRRMISARRPEFPRFRCVVPSWDNTSRRSSGATILNEATPDLYQYWLEQTLLGEVRTATAGGSSPGMPFVFINAWNEWAEGNHLEPDQRWGHAYLKATRNALQNVHSGKVLPPPSEFGSFDSDDAQGFSVTLLRAAAHSVASVTLEHAGQAMATTRAELDALVEEIRYLDRVEQLIDAIESFVPASAPFVLVDDLQLGLGRSVRGRPALPFLERGGEYWGAPPDDDTAVQELDRMIEGGISHVVVAWPSTWYLKHYPKWSARLRSVLPTVTEGPDMVGFRRT